MEKTNQVFWTMKDGTQIDIDNMSINHLRNTLKMIIRNINIQKEEKEVYTRLTKGDLIKIIAENSDLSEYKAKKFMSALLDEIKDQMAAKSEVKLDDFGRFYTKEHKSREAINPQTFEPIVIDAYTAVKFSAYKPFKDMPAIQDIFTVNITKEEEAKIQTVSRESTIQW